MTPGLFRAQTEAEAERLLSAAGFGPDMAPWLCDQAALDHPGYDITWAFAVAGDVRTLCTDPVSFDDGGQP